MKVIYGCIFFLLTFITAAFSQDKCKTQIEHSVIENAHNTYSIALQSPENFRNLQVELYDLYEGKIIEKKQLTSGLKAKSVVFTKVKPSLYLIYIKHDECSRAQSVGGINGIKVGNIE